MPSLPDIQKTLVAMGDKQPTLIGSHDWIGSVEVAMVIDKLYDVSIIQKPVQIGEKRWVSG